MSKTIAVFGSPFKPREYMLIISNATFPPKECPTTVSIVMLFFCKVSYTSVANVLIVTGSSTNGESP